MTDSKMVAHFDITYQRFLNEEGKVEQPLPAFAENVEHLQTLYKWMVQTRLFDAKAIALQRTGNLGTYPSTLGQEAIGVGIGAAMQPKDILAPYYRETGGQLMRGVTMKDVLLYWGGDERGSDFQGDARKDFPFCIPIASQTLHAVGAAAALQCRNEPNAVVTAIGEGGTSRGDFYESLNVAGAWQLPIVFVVNNNHWAISVRCEKQTGAKTFAQKAFAGGLKALQVDGNDVIAVQEAVQSALEEARQGKGATVIEALTYRMGDHTTADDASRYRPQEELELHKKQDPIIRLRQYLASIQAWDENKEKALYQSLTQEVNEAVEAYQNTPKRKPESMFEYLYDTVPAAYQSQYDELKGRG